MPSYQEFLYKLNQYSDLARADKFDVRMQPPSALVGGYGQAGRDLPFQCENAELPGRTMSTFEARTSGPHVKYPYETTYSPLVLTFICTGNRNPNPFGGLLSSAIGVGQAIGPFGGEVVGAAGNRINSQIQGFVPNAIGSVSPLASEIVSGFLAPKNNGLWEKSFFDDWLELISPTPQSTNVGYYNMEYKDNYTTDITVNHYDTNGYRTYSVNLIDAFPISVNQLALSWQDESILRLTVEFAYTRWERTTAVYAPNPGTNTQISTSQNPNYPSPIDPPEEVTVNGS